MAGWWASGLAVGALVAGVATWTAAGAWIGAGFFAKQLCSAVYVSGRQPEQVVDSDLRLYLPSFVHRPMGWKIDEGTHTVRARWLRGIEREAIYRGAHGCQLVYDRNRRVVAGAAGAARVEEMRRVGDAWLGARGLPHVADAPLLEATLAGAFDGANSQGTRAVIVVHRGAVVAERYADGFGPGTRLPGWSLSKSVMNGLIGALVQQGVLRVDDPVPVPSWRAPGDPRSAVTYDHLLRMSSGLRFDENYDDPFSDVTRMLFGVRDAGAYAEHRPLIAAPGTVWSYSSGSTMVLAHALAAHARSSEDYRRLPQRLLFDRLGMRSAVMETDASGTFEATSSVYATALDWARFGWLYASDGVWNGTRILPSGWVRYTTTPTRADPSGRYGAHFWLHTAADREEAERDGLGRLAPDAFYADGFGGQRITIVPSMQVVIVRLGAGSERKAPFDNTRFAAHILGALVGAGVPRLPRTEAEAAQPADRS